MHIHASVGAALSQWETLETLVSSLYALVAGAPNSRAAQRAYGTITNVRGKCDALRAAGEVFFTEDRDEPVGWASFNELVDNYCNAAPRRNDVAHGVATQDDRGAFLVPPDYATRKIKIVAPPEKNSAKTRRIYEYSSPDIDGFTTKFRALTKMVNDYQAGLYARYLS